MSEGKETTHRLKHRWENIITLDLTEAQWEVSSGSGQKLAMGSCVYSTKMFISAQNKEFSYYLYDYSLLKVSAT
jgi:hypothetical protein